MKGLQEFKIVIVEDKIQDKKRCIRGHVHVVIDENKVLRKEIKVKYICKAWTDWKEVNMGICGVQHFKNMQLLAKHKDVLHQAQDPPLEPGVHNLPFTFNINIATLPPTFEAPYGRIKHRIKAVLRSSIMTEAAKDTWEFTSAPMSDLNTQAELAHSVAVDKAMYGKLGRFAKPLRTIKVTLDKSGYVSGENIQITIEMNRDCNTKQPIEASLRQVVQFIGSSMQSMSTQKRSIANILNSVVTEQLSEPAPCEMCTITMPELIVPPAPPSGLTGVKIITLNYDIMVSSKDLDVKIPVVIGNVPLRIQSSCASQARSDDPPSFEELGLPAITEECDDINEPE